MTVDAREILASSLPQSLVTTFTDQLQQRDDGIDACQELKTIYTIGWPLAFSQAAAVLQGLSNAILLGHYDTAALAAVTVSSIWTSVADTMLFSGISQLSTLCSQAYGAGNLPLLGIWLQIFLVFSLIAALPVALMRWFTADILKLVGVPPDVAELAGVYTIWSQLAFVFDLWFLSCKEFFAAQNITRPAAFIDFVFIFVNIAMGYTAVFVLRWGIVGVGISTSIMRFSRTVVYVLYCRCMGYHRRAWHGWSCSEIFVWERWRRLLALLLPAAFGGLAEELQFQVCTLIAARLGSAEVAAFNLMLNLLLASLLISMSLGEATGIRTAHFLGALKPVAARSVSRIGVILSVVICAMLGAMLSVGFKYLTHWVSTDVAVQQELRKMSFSAGVVVALLGGFIPLVVVLTKQGRAGIVGAVIPLMCWGAGFPISIIFSHVQGVLGIIVGLMVGYGLAMSVLLIFYLRSDWQSLAEKAQEAAEIGPASVEDSVVSLQPVA